MISQLNLVFVQKVNLNGMERIVLDAIQASFGVTTTKCVFNAHKIHTIMQLMDLALHVLLLQHTILILFPVSLLFVKRVKISVTTC